MAATTNTVSLPPDVWNIIFDHVAWSTHDDWKKDMTRPDVKSLAPLMQTSKLFHQELSWRLRHLHEVEESHKMRLMMEEDGLF